MEYLYHCSPAAGLCQLRPSVTEHFGKPKQVCLTSLLPMALLYGVKHFEYTYGYTKEGQIYYEECFPNALEIIYKGKAASLYTCCPRGDMRPTAIPNEYVTAQPVPVEGEKRIPDVYGALLEQERLGTLRIIRYEEQSEKSRAWYRKAHAEDIAEKGLLTRDTPYARYMKETYPESWALAQKEKHDRTHS